MSAYAKGTTVPVARTLDELQRVLRARGVERFVHDQQDHLAQVLFIRQGRGYRLGLPLPDPRSPEFTRTPARGKRRNEAEARAHYDAEVRRRYRALLLLVKARLEAVDTGITTFETEFLHAVVLPGGATIAEHIAPQLDDADALGTLPLLPQRLLGVEP